MGCVASKKSNTADVSEEDSSARRLGEDSDDLPRRDDGTLDLSSLLARTSSGRVIEPPRDDEMEESGEHGGEGTGMRGGTSSRGGLRKTPSGGSTSPSRRARTSADASMSPSNSVQFRGDNLSVRHDRNASTRRLGGRERLETAQRFPSSGALTSPYKAERPEEFERSISGGGNKSQGEPGERAGMMSPVSSRGNMMSDRKTGYDRADRTPSLEHLNEARKRGIGWAPPVKSTSIVAQARKRAMHKRTLSEEPSAFVGAQLAYRAPTGLEDVKEVPTRYQRAQFLEAVNVAVSEMKERQDFVRRLTLETIESCRALAELEGPVEALLRLENIDKNASEVLSMQQPKATKRVEFASHTHSGSGFAEPSSNSVFSEDGDEVSSAVSTHSFQMETSPRTSDKSVDFVIQTPKEEFSLDAVEAELRAIAVNASLVDEQPRIET